MPTYSASVVLTSFALLSTVRRKVSVWPFGRATTDANISETSRLASAPEFADFGAAANLEVSEMFASVVARPKGQTETFLRTVLKSAKDVKTTEAEYVGMKNVYSTVSGTMNRIAGNYFEPAVEGALVQPSKQIDDIQRILRT
jgi:hypothetical protein